MGPTRTGRLSGDQEVRGGQAGKGRVVSGFRAAVKRLEEFTFFGRKLDSSVVAVRNGGSGGGLVAGQRTGDRFGGDRGGRGWRPGAEGPQSLAPATPEHGGDELLGHAEEVELARGGGALLEDCAKHIVGDVGAFAGVRDYVQREEGFGMRGFDGEAGMAEKALAEKAADEPIEVLLAREKTGAGGFEAGLDVVGLREGVGEEVRFGGELEVVRCGVGGELVEVGRGGVWDEVFVEDVVVGLFAGFGPFRLEVAGVEGIGTDEIGGQRIEGLAWIGELAECIADGAAEVPAGKDVVGDVGDAVGREGLPDDVKNAVANGGGNPGVDAVGDDVVEAVWLGMEIGDGGAAEIGIAGADGGGDFVGAVDVEGVVVETGALRAGEGLAHGQEVEAGAAADFKDA